MRCAIKNILFDLGNVLINFDHTIAARRILPFTEKSIQEIYSLFFNSKATEFFEEGKLTPADFFMEVKKMLGLKIEFDAFLPIWNEIFFLTDENRAVRQAALALAARYSLAVLSNINVLHFEYLKKHFPIFEGFHNVFTSCELGYIKPNPLIYQKVLQLLGVSAGEVFYTDDRPELIEQARALGINGFVFKGSEQLKLDLASCGIHLD
jgi:FMN phosphatase YigB (HAD superfamily)